MHRLDQGQSYLPEKQTSLEDRYYNNQSFQEEYPVNDPEINNAATKIQANFRGHKARQNTEKLKQENKQMVDTDQQDLGYSGNQSVTPNQERYDEDEKALASPKGQTPQPTETKETVDPTKVEDEPDEEFPEELTEEEKEEQERAARSIQAKFRGLQLRKSANKDRPSPNQQQNQESDNEKIPTPTSTRLSGKLDSDRQDLSGKLDSDRQDLGGNLTANDQIETGEEVDTDRPRLEREPTQLSEDFERHTQIPRDSDFNREPRPDLNYDEDDMNDPTLDKAATRIQASYRGYKTRKELGGGGSQDQLQHPTSTSPLTHDEYDNAHNKILSPSAEGNKEAEGEEDDNAAAVKIQAAFRGYKVRKDLEK